MRTIAIACDHAAIELKNIVRDQLTARGFAVEDVGTYTTESCDYPVFAHRACVKVQSGACEMAILICGTGIGISLAANKVKGIRCALCHNEFTAQMC